MESEGITTHCIFRRFPVTTWISSMILMSLLWISSSGSGSWALRPRITVLTVSYAENKKWMPATKMEMTPAKIQKCAEAYTDTGRKIAVNTAVTTKYNSMRIKKNDQMRQFFCRSMSMKVKGIVYVVEMRG
jgi:hypothetical protein